MRYASKILLAMIGVGVLVWFLSRANLTEIGQALGRLGWLAPLLLLPYFTVYLVETAAWRSAFKQRPGVSFPTLFRVRWMGDAVNNILPSAYIGGEALKVYLLSKRGVPTSLGAPASLISKTVQTMAQLVFIALAGLAFLAIGVVPAAFRTGMLIVLAIGTVLVGALFWIQFRGLFRVVFDVLSLPLLRIAGLEKRRADLLRFDAEVSSFYRGRPRRFLVCFSGYFSAWMLDSTEILLASHLLGMPVTWTQALAIEGFVGVAKALSVVIPGALGVQESSIVFLCRMAGVPDAFGFTYAILRRARDVFFVLIGWKLLLLEEGTFKGLTRKVRSLTGD
jgi:uncharacterized protein (TIRG00374 family)